MAGKVCKECGEERREEGVLKKQRNSSAIILAKSEWRSGLVQQQLEWRRLKVWKSMCIFLEMMY